MARKSSRRGFLKGKSAADAIADTLRRAVPDVPGEGLPDKPAVEGYLVRVERRAMACQFEVSLNAGQYPDGVEAALEALDLVEALEERMSVFRSTSQISRINRLAASEPVEVEPRLFGLLELALALYAETDGAFDITSEPLSEAWGFSRRAGKIPSDEELARAMRRVGGHFVELDGKRKTVHFRRSGIGLNLGGIGKGYALDRAAETLTAAGIDDFLFHGGQSSVLARGSSATTPGTGSEGPAGGWIVGLRHPLRRVRLAEIRLENRALATSGSARQFFRHQGRRYGHILDPRTGRPAEGVFSVTVIAESAAMADALSTAFYVLGPDAALDYCRGRSNLAAILICPSDVSPGFEVKSTGLAEDAMRILDGP